MAGFGVTLYGRIWVTPEALTACRGPIWDGSSRRTATVPKMALDCGFEMLVLR